MRRRRRPTDWRQIGFNWRAAVVVYLNISILYCCYYYEVKIYMNTIEYVFQRLLYIFDVLLSFVDIKIIPVIPTYLHVSLPRAVTDRRP